MKLNNIHKLIIDYLRDWKNLWRTNKQIRDFLFIEHNIKISAVEIRQYIWDLRARKCKIIASGNGYMLTKKIEWLQDYKDKRVREIKKEFWVLNNLI